MFYDSLLCCFILFISRLVSAIPLNPLSQGGDLTSDNTPYNCRPIRNLTTSVSILHFAKLVLTRLTRRALPFPRIYAVPGSQDSVFLHVMCAWRPMNEQDYFATNHALQTALIGKLRTRGDLTLDAVGIQRRVGPVEMSTSSHHTGRYHIPHLRLSLGFLSR